MANITPRRLGKTLRNDYKIPMDIKIIATLMTFILGSLILFSRSWSRRERFSHDLEAKYALSLLKYQGNSADELETLLAEGELRSLALDLGRARGRDEATALESLKADLLHVLNKN